MFRFNYQIPGTSPSLLLQREDSADKPPVLTMLSYNETGYLEIPIHSVEEIQAHLKPDFIHWINLQGIGDAKVIRALGDLFKLHTLALEDVLNLTQRPKFESYEGFDFIVSSMMYFRSPAVVNSEQFSIFLGKNFVLTMQEERGMDFFERIRSRIRLGQGYVRKMKSDYLLYAILDAIIDNNFPILEKIGDGLEQLETALMENPNQENLSRLHDVKRLLIQVRKELWPHREIFASLMRDEGGLLHKKTQVFFRDCYDHTIQQIELVEGYRDLTVGLMDVYRSSIGMRTNEIMRVLTLVSTIFIPLTFLAGVYGMNFKDGDGKHPWNMPELSHDYGYPLFWVVCITLAVSMFIFFKRKKWL